MPKGIPLTENELRSRRRTIAQASAELFLGQGFPETSMREIASAAGMGKSSLYDYFATKDEILLFIVDEHSLTLIERGRTLAALALPAETRIRRIMEMQLRYLQENDSLFWLLSAELQRLKPESQKRIQARRYEFQDLMREVIEQGIASGHFRPVDGLLVARLLINGSISIPYTSRPTASAEVMLNETLEIILRGIAP